MAGAGGGGRGPTVNNVNNSSNSSAWSWNAAANMWTTNTANTVLNNSSSVSALSSVFAPYANTTYNTVNNAGGGRGGGGGAGRGRGRLPFGVGGILGFGTAAGAVARDIYATREYAIDEILAGTDQRAQLDATLAYREKIADSGLFVGRTIAYLQDPSGGAEAGIRATLNASELQDKRTTRIRATFEGNQSLREGATVAGIRQPFARSVAQFGFARERALREIQYAREAEGEAIGKETGAFAAGLEAELVQHRSRFAGFAYDDESTDIRRSDNQRRVAAFRGERSAKADARAAEERDLTNRLYDAKTAAAERDETFRLIEQRGGVATDIAISNALTRNDPQAARIAAIQGENAQQIIGAIGRGEAFGDIINITRAGGARTTAANTQYQRQVAHEELEISDRRRVTESLIERNPLQAEIRAIQARYGKDIRDLPDTEEGRRLAGQYRLSQADEITLARQRDDDRKRYRSESLLADARETRLELQDRPRAGAAGREADAAKLEVEKLREQEGDPGNANQVIQNAILEQQAIERRMLRGAHAVQVGINETDFSGAPRGSEEDSKYFASIDENIKGLRADLKSGAGAQTVP